MESQHQTMEEGETRNTLKELDHLGTRIEPVLPGTPRLECRAGDLQPCGGLPLGQPLGL
jgi:hypothetical protein